ncbi:MAG TPA: cyclodeaminase/cyclohydrolase family protein [Thermoleophilia bacterium]|nr:cyclodeaminase/cyclohydrolase family protein [Thermoleophilia bacterium]
MSSDAPVVYATKPLCVYLDDAASNKPAPGGGSVSALVGALGAALVSMVCNLTRGHEKFSGVEEQIQALVVRSEATRTTLEGLLQDDTTAYNGVIAAYRLPKETETEVAARKAAIQAGLIVAATVPLEICRASLEVCGLSRTAAELGNPQAVTDAGIGAVLGEAAVVSAALNVTINLGSIEDAAYVAATAAEIDALQAEAAELRAEVLGITHTKL